MVGFKQDANTSPSAQTLTSTPSAFSPFLQYVLQRHLFKLPKSDAESFTMQVHYDLVHLFLPPRLIFAFGCDCKGCDHATVQSFVL